jgi:hypothetical protein
LKGIKCATADLDSFADKYVAETLHLSEKCSFCEILLAKRVDWGQMFAVEPIRFIGDGAMSLRWARRLADDDRQSISRQELQSAIADAVKMAEPDCRDFVGVIVDRETPQSRYDTNWAIRGVRFGKSDRDKSTQALNIIVSRLQREFRLKGDPDV